MSQEIIQTLLATCEAIGAAILSGVLAVLITHRLAIDRDRIVGIETRKRAFLAFLASWRYEIGRKSLHPGGGGFERHESSFGDVIPRFIEEADFIKWDFTKRKRKQFEVLCAAITGSEYPSIYNQKDYEKAIKAMDDIIAFVDDARA